MPGFETLYILHVLFPCNFAITVLSSTHTTSELASTHTTSELASCNATVLAYSSYFEDVIIIATLTLLQMFKFLRGLVFSSRRCKNKSQCKFVIPK